MATKHPLQTLVARAVDEAAALGAPRTEPVHIFLSLLAEPSDRLVEVFADHMVDASGLRTRVREAIRREGPHNQAPQISTRTAELLRNASNVEAVHSRFVGYLRNYQHTILARALSSASISPLRMAVMLEKVCGDRAQAVGTSLETRPEPPEKASQAPRSRPWNKTQAGILDEMGVDLTALARSGQLDPVIGRRDEIKQVARSLLRKGKSCPVLVGDAGVGKTSIVYGLCQHIVADDAPKAIRDLRVVEISPASVVAGTRNRGDLEERLEKMIKHAESSPDIVIFLDEIHNLMGANASATDATAVLKPALARGTIRCIGACTTDDYKKHIEKDSALERRFQPIRVDEPSEEDTLEILQGLRGTYEEHHEVRITDEALEAAIELSVRHLPDRRLPDKARDLIDQAAATQRFASLSPRTSSPDGLFPIVARGEIADVVSEWSGIPAGRLSQDEKQRLMHLEEALTRRVIGQDHALERVARVIRTARAGLAKPGRPHGVFLFLGPTGVGKTETARALAEFLFDDEARLLRFDMSEYMEPHSVSKLIGSPPGYVGHEEGGKLTDAIRRSPYAVVLFDEVEKAHPRVADLFLQIFDDGRLTDSQGRAASFGHAVIIMTSNLGAGASTPKRAVGFSGGQEAETARDTQALRDVLKQHFRPELLNRVSEVVSFNPLRPEDVRNIIDKMIRGVEGRLAEKDIRLELTLEAYDRLLELGYDKENGAREMDRIVEQTIVHPLAERVIDGQVSPGSRVSVDVDETNNIALNVRVEAEIIE